MFLAGWFNHILWICTLLLRLYQGRQKRKIKEAKMITLPSAKQTATCVNEEWGSVIAERKECAPDLDFVTKTAWK